jgi:hypothetical protein
MYEKIRLNAMISFHPALGQDIQVPLKIFSMHIFVMYPCWSIFAPRFKKRL